MPLNSGSVQIDALFARERPALSLVIFGCTWFAVFPSELLSGQAPVHSNAAGGAFLGVQIARLQAIGREHGTQRVRVNCTHQNRVLAHGVENRVGRHAVEDRRRAGELVVGAER